MNGLTVPKTLIYESADAAPEACDITQANGETKGGYRVRLFSERPNRRGDIVVVAGMDTTQYERNPVVLLEHGFGYRLPIGRATNLTAGKTFMDAEFVFDPDDEMAQAVERKFANGFMQSVSVGYNIQEAELVDPDDDGWFAPRRFTKTQLLEFSVVSVPADTTAMRKQALTALAESKERNETITLADIWTPDSISIEV